MDAPEADGSTDNGVEKETDEKPAQDSKPASEWLFEGYARIGYRLRYTREYTDATEEDQDVRGILSLSLEDREKKPRFSFNLLGSFNLDVDGDPAGGCGPYCDVYNSYESNLKAQLYSAYIESRFDGTKLFVGRQSVYRGESLDFDGVRAEHRIVKDVNLSAYGGIPSNYWESSHDGDHFAGGGAELGVPKIFSLRADYVHIRDKKTMEPDDPVAKDNLVIISGKYLELKPLSVYGLYSTVNGDERRAMVRAKWADKANRLLVSASFLRQNKTLTDYSTELSPYYVVLADYAPYYKYKLMVLKGLSRNFEIEAGADFRELADDSDEGMLNHSYERFYGGFHLKKILKKKVDLTLMAEKWNASDTNDMVVVEGLVKLSLGKKLAVRIGSDFSRYVYDYSFKEERENVYCTFVRADYRFSGAGKFRFRYSFNGDEREDYHLFEASLIFSW